MEATSFVHNIWPARDGLRLLLREIFSRSLEAARRQDPDRALPMLESFARPLPAHARLSTLHEHDYLALDIGGTNYRIYYVQFRENKLARHFFRNFTLSGEILNGTREQFFRFIAQTIQQFLLEPDCLAVGGSSRHYNMGVTFSFPTRQQAVNRAYLLHWTKNFHISDMQDCEIVSSLEAALRQARLSVSVKCILNDTVATLVGSSIEHTDCCIAVIVGTGTNACFHDERGTGTIINTEWGALGQSDGCLAAHQTKYDTRLDRESLYPGKQIFEKMCSGRYLGELLRLMLVDMTEQGLIFANTTPPPERLHQRDSIKAESVSELAALLDNEPDQVDIFQLLFAEPAAPGDCKHEIRLICQLSLQLLTRSAHLVAIGLAAIIDLIGAHSGTIALDGGLFRNQHFPYGNLVKSHLNDLLLNNDGQTDQNFKFQFALSVEGSGIGAAALAASVSASADA